MELTLFDFMIACIFCLLIPILFKLKDYLYKRKKYKSNRYENPIFLTLCFLCLYMLGYYTNKGFFYWASWPFLSYILTPIFVYLLNRKKKGKDWPILGRKP